MRRPDRHECSVAPWWHLAGPSLHAAPAAAIDLLRSYELALVNDGQLKVARARADSGREALPQATSQLLPNMSVSAAYGQTEQDRSLGSVTEPTQHYPSERCASRCASRSSVNTSSRRSTRPRSKVARRRPTRQRLPGAGACAWSARTSMRCSPGTVSTLSWRRGRPTRRSCARRSWRLRRDRERAPTSTISRPTTTSSSPTKSRRGRGSWRRRCSSRSSSASRLIGWRRSTRRASGPTRMTRDHCRSGWTARSRTTRNCGR